jgi:hypothetical protein
MLGTEYKVLPAPNKGLKGRGVKGAEARFAHALETLMNEMAAEGWHYLRSDMLPHEERHGLRSTQTTYRSVLVFRRDTPLEEDMPDAHMSDKAASVLPPEPVLTRAQADKGKDAEGSNPASTTEADEPETPAPEGETSPERPG